MTVEGKAWRMGMKEKKNVNVFFQIMMRVNVYYKSDSNFLNILQTWKYFRPTSTF